MRKVIVGVIAGCFALSFGGVASGGVIGDITVDPMSGPPGTTVTVTVTNCGLDAQQDLSAPAGIGAYVPGTGQLIVTVIGWGEPFETGFEGGTNDENGIATATFSVPEVTPEEYTIEGDCVDITPCGAGVVAACAVATDADGLRPLAFGPYAPTPFTVTTPVVTPGAQVAPAVEAQASTTG